VRKKKSLIKEGKIMSRNPWLKLTALSFAGIIISFVLLWGINQFSSLNSNQGNIYQNGIQTSMNIGSNGMNMQGNMSMHGNISSGMGMMGNMNNSQTNMGMD